MGGHVPDDGSHEPDAGQRSVEAEPSVAIPYKYKAYVKIYSDKTRKLNALPGEAGIEH